MILVDMEMPRFCCECPLTRKDKILGYICCPQDKPISVDLDTGLDGGGCPIKAEIPDNATNGDVIKTLFPNDCVKQENGDKIVFSFIKAAGTIIIDADWWNAPYKPESEELK